MPDQSIEFDAGSYREPAEWEQTSHHILDHSSRLIPITSLKYCGSLLTTFAPTSGVVVGWFVCLAWLRTCSPSPIQLLEEVWERKDLTELHLGWVIRLCVCLFTVPHSKLQLICIVWVNTAMNYSLWIKAQEPFSFSISFPSSSPLLAEYILNIL